MPWKKARLSRPRPDDVSPEAVLEPQFDLRDTSALQHDIRTPLLLEGAAQCRPTSAEQQACRPAGGDTGACGASLDQLPTHPTSLPEPSPAGDWGRSDWKAGYLNCPEDPAGHWMPVEGCLPAELMGTYLRIGPGIFELGGQTVSHPYDGHGIVASISFHDGRAFFRSKFVNTAEYQEEVQQQGSFLFPGSFGTGSQGSRLPTFVPKNAANTNIVPWRGGLLAMFESGQPHHLQAQSLQTQGLDLLAGALKAGVPLQTPFSAVDAAVGWVLRRAACTPGLDERLRLGGDALCSHCCTDASTGRTVFLRYRLKLQCCPPDLPEQQGCGSNPGQTCAQWLSHLRARAARQIPGLVTCFTFCEFDEKGHLYSECSHTVPGYAFVHDFAITQSYYVLCLNPVSLSLRKLLGGASCVASVQDDKLQGKPAKSARPSILSLPAPAQELARLQGLPETPLKMRLIPRDQHQHGVSRAPAKAACGSRPSPQPQEVVQVEAPHAFVFHHANAHESPGGQSIVVDSIAYACFPGFFELGQKGYDFFRDIHPATSPISRLWRHTICLKTRRVTQHLLCPRAAEFPAINPAVSGVRHRYVYAGLALHACQNGPQQALGRIDVETGEVQSWTRGPRYFVGEPTFVARGKQAAEDDGWLVAICFDAARQRSEAVVLNAQNLTAGPVAVLPLRTILPHGLHGCWHDAYLGPDSR